MAGMRNRRIIVALFGALARVVALGVLVGLGACGPAQPAVAPAPKGPTACARASDTMVQTMLDRLSSDGPPPTEAADALRNLIRERCEQDGWSAEATKCLIAMTSVKDAEPCAKLMTDEQQAALVRDEAALFGPADAKAAGQPVSDTPANGDPPAAKSEKPND
jgi:hypothetical protein